MHDDIAVAPSYSEENKTELLRNSYFSYLDEISKYKLLSAEEEANLFLRIQAGDNVAKDLFIKSNLRLVIKIAKPFFIPGTNELSDLIQEGNIGLIKAIERYDPSLGTKFSTLAFWYIKKEIQTFLSQTSLPVSLPPHKFSLLQKINFAYSSLTSSGCNDPSPEEIAQFLGEPLHKVLELLPLSVSPLPFNAAISDTDSRETITVFDEYYGSEVFSEAENRIIQSEMHREMYRLVHTLLTEREIYVLCSLRGLFNMPQKSANALAAEFGVSHQAVRQTEDRAVKKLQKHLLSSKKSFSDFL